MDCVEISSLGGIAAAPPEADPVIGNAPRVDTTVEHCSLQVALSLRRNLNALYAARTTIGKIDVHQHIGRPADGHQLFYQRRPMGSGTGPIHIPASRET